jgi:hypothetical protein
LAPRSPRAAPLGAPGEPILLQKRSSLPLDALHSVLFYAFSAVAVAAGLATALLPSRAQRGSALIVAGAGLAGLLAVLSAGFAALVALLCFGACGLALGTPGYRVVWSGATGRWEQAGAIACGVLFAILLYASWRTDYFDGSYPGGSFGAAAVGRLLLAHDGLAGDALALVALVAFVAAGLFWRARLR